MDALDPVLMFLGSSVCHQLVDRSYTIGDAQMPLCARCMGIHVGFLISAVFLWVGPRRFASRLPSRNALIVLGLIMSVMFIDGGLSYSNLFQSDNLRRTLSGLAFGVPLPFVLFPLLNMIAFPGRDSRAPIAGWKDWLMLSLLYSVGAAAILLAPSAPALFVAVSVAGVIGVFAVYSTVIFVILSLLLEKRSLRLRTRASGAVFLAVSFLLISAAFHTAYLPALSGA